MPRVLLEVSLDPKDLALEAEPEACRRLTGVSSGSRDGLA